MFQKESKLFKKNETDFWFIGMLTFVYWIKYIHSF